jgi:hypothetical protein
MGVKEIVGHMSDTERFYLPCHAHRARRPSPLPGFEQDDYIQERRFGKGLADLAEEFAAVRSGSIALFRSLNVMRLGARRGGASGKGVAMRRRWPSWSQGMNCITKAYWKSAISRRFRGRNHDCADLIQALR